VGQPFLGRPSKLGFRTKGVLDFAKAYACTSEGQGEVEEHFVTPTGLPFRASPDVLGPLNQHLVNTGPRNLGLAQHFDPRLQRKRHVLEPGRGLQGAAFALGIIVEEAFPGMLCTSYGGLGSGESCRATGCRTKSECYSPATTTGLPDLICGHLSQMKNSSFFSRNFRRKCPTLEHSRSIFFRKCQSPGAELHSSLATLGMPRFARLARCEYLASDPNERTEAPLLRSRPRSGFPARKSWPEKYRSARKEKSKIEDRTSIGTRTRTHPYRVCVRSSALSFPFG